MPAVALEGKLSLGHGCFPPTNAVGPYTIKSFFNGLTIQLLNHTKYAAHTCNRTTHPVDSRVTSSASSTFFLEGKAVCRIGDDIACGDKIAGGSSNAFVG
jgi:uncharacterized Zn-binding protein involved in type VI secretion